MLIAVLPTVDSNHRRLLLGTRDWQRPDWVAHYYPSDLPPEWRLAYYGNDADCVLLPASIWTDPAHELDEQFEEAPEHLLFFLEAAAPSATHDAFERRFRGRRAVVLAADSTAPESVPSWPGDPAGGWRDPNSRGLLRCLDVPEFDLRALRRDIEALPPDVVVLILDGASASPARLGEVRTLIELLGRG